MNKYIKDYPINRNSFAILLLLFVPAFVIRYFFANAQIIAPDGLLYIKIAKSIALGDFQGISEYGFFNFYSFLIALFHTLFFDWEFSGKIVSIVFGSLTIIPLFYLIRGFFSQSVAIAATLLYTVHPRFIEYSSDVLREPVFWFFSITALWLARESLSRNKIFLLVLSSLASGFALFTRLEGALVVVIVVLWILWFYLNEKKNRKNYLLYTCVFLLSVPILASPSLLLLKNKLNRWETGHTIQKIHQLVQSNTQPLELEAEFLVQPSGKLQAFFDVSARHRYITFLMEVIYTFFKSFNVVLFIFFLFGIYKRQLMPYSKNDMNVLIWFSVVFIALFLYMTKIYYISTRHGLLMVFPALAWAAIGFFEIRERIRTWLDRKGLIQKYARFDTIFLFVLILIVLVPQTLLSYRSDKVELKKAGVMLKRGGFSKTVFVIQPSLNRVAFYADSDIVHLPKEANGNKIMDFINEYRGGLLIIDERTIDGYAPGIRRIVAECKFEKLVLPEINQYREYSFSIYKIN